jgi:hypothetical protein
MVSDNSYVVPPKDISATMPFVTMGLEVMS